MICKECGAYNPDHATYCKVCAANLKGEAATEKVEAPEEEQPTKRFSRPSWVVPEQAEQLNNHVSDAVEQAEEITEDIPEQAESVQEEAEAVEKADVIVEETAEEEIPQIWSPVSSRRKVTLDPMEEDKDENDDEEQEATEDFDDENETIYNDEEALEDEDTSFEYEPTPPKRKQQKKKNNTMFTVLLIAIIVVIVAVLVIGGILLLKNKPSCLGASRSNGDGSSSSDDPGNNPADADGQGDSVDPSGSSDQSSDEPDAYNAVIKDEKGENNEDLVSITAVVPAKSKLTIHFPNQNDYEYENEDDKDKQRKVKIPVQVFYKNEPLEESTVEFFPEITITSPDGSSYKVNCKSFTRTFPTLNITLTAPMPNDDGIIMAPESNTVTIQGTIDDPTAEITINGVVAPKYEGGIFIYEYKLADGIGEDDSETVTILAKNKNCVSDSEEISIHAYKFIPEPMKLEVPPPASSLRADTTAAKLTITGTTLPGATLSAVSDNTTNVLCGSVNVDNEGNFSFQITMDAAFYGMSTITLDAQKEGAENGSTKFTVTKGFADKSAFIKYYGKTKTYLEVNPKPSKTNQISITDMLANPTQYASNGYGFRITAKVVEVSEVEGDTIIKMTVHKSGETIYVHKLSTVMDPANNIGKYYNVYGNYVGTYSDTGCIEFLGWFAEGKKNIKD